jgi:hypothetical protein
MSKDLFHSYLLRVYYEENWIGRNGYDVPFEFLYDDELESINNSLGFAIFKVRYSILLFITKVANALKI